MLHRGDDEFKVNFRRLYESWKHTSNIQEQSKSVVAKDFKPWVGKNKIEWFYSERLKNFSPIRILLGNSLWTGSGQMLENFGLLWESKRGNFKEEEWL